MRELSVFWALVSARQAGLITSYEEFSEMAQNLIDFCGVPFAKECQIKTVKSAFAKDYHAKTTTLLEILQITPKAQKEMKVLRIGQRATSKKQPKQTRAEYLATHDQTRREVWKLYGLSERTYYRRKKAGKLPPLLTQLQASGIIFISPFTRRYSVNCPEGTRKMHLIRIAYGSSNLSYVKFCERQ